MKPLIEVVRDFIKTCPYLPEFESGVKQIGVDFLGGDPETYVVESMPVDPVVKTYVNGDAEKQFGFIFASKEYYGRDAIINIENLGFYDNFAVWLTQQTLFRKLPKLDGGRTALSMEATLTPYLFDVDPDASVARYQIQCVLKYFEPAPKQPGM